MPDCKRTSLYHVVCTRHGVEVRYSRENRYIVTCATIDEAVEIAILLDSEASAVVEVSA